MALEPFEVLYEADLREYKLPADLHHLYGRLGFAARVVYSNFVSSLDGVVTLGSKPSAGSIISGKYPADRFLMGLLRACADAVLIGAGTLRATPGHLWTPGHVFPDLATEFIALRSALGRSREPQLVVVTASGDIDASHPAIVKGALVMTTAEGARAIGNRLPKSCEVVAIGTGKRLDIGKAIVRMAVEAYPDRQGDRRTDQPRSERRAHGGRAPPDRSIDRKRLAGRSLPHHLACDRRQEGR